MKNKYICLFLFVFLALLLTFPFVSANAPLNGKTILIDIGHGGIG